MGDRANVKVLQGANEPAVWLYSHWGGGAFQKEAINISMGVEAVGRVGDPSYFTRILVEGLIDDISGIGTSIEDNEHEVLIIDSMSGEHWFAPEDESRG